ncbi:hypothetical protein GW796_00490 [archaeon]|nr:hypothetical protein [archaeon]
MIASSQAIHSHRDSHSFLVVSCNIACSDTTCNIFQVNKHSIVNDDSLILNTRFLQGISYHKSHINVLQYLKYVVPI